MVMINEKVETHIPRICYLCKLWGHRVESKGGVWPFVACMIAMWTGGVTGTFF